MKFKKAIKEVLYKLLSGSKGYSDLKVISGPAKGVKLRLDLRKEGSYWLGTYDKWLFDSIPFSNYISPGNVVWDCGAYVGYYAAVSRKIVGSEGKVYVFEASSNNSIPTSSAMFSSGLRLFIFLNNLLTEFHL